MVIIFIYQRKKPQITNHRLTKNEHLSKELGISARNIYLVELQS